MFRAVWERGEEGWAVCLQEPSVRSLHTLSLLKGQGSKVPLITLPQQLSSATIHQARLATHPRERQREAGSWPRPLEVTVSLSEHLSRGR